MNAILSSSNCRCPLHPQHVTASLDGVLDAPCPECEAHNEPETEEDGTGFVVIRRYDPSASTKPAPPLSNLEDDDFPF